VIIERFRQFSPRGKALAITAILLAGSGVLLGAARFARRGPNLPTIEVRRGEFLDSLQFRGEMKALKSLTISAPSEAGDLQIIKLAPEGTVVKSGDLVVQFDGTKIQQQLAASEQLFNETSPSKLVWICWWVFGSVTFGS